MSWKCSCGVLNNGLNKSCVAERQAVISYSGVHRPITENSYDELVSYTAHREIRKLDMALANTMMDDREELFRQFFNAEKISVKDMDIPSLREHRNKLEKIAFEARARLTAIDAEERERQAKLNPNQRSWIGPIEHDTNVSDAIKTVEKRKERMSKFDKMAEGMKSIGMTDADVKEMMNKVSKRATESSVDQFKFVRPKSDGETDIVKTETDTESLDKPEADSFSNVFDASDLFGKKDD